MRFRKGYHTIPQIRYIAVHRVDYDSYLSSVHTNAIEFASIGDDSVS